MCDYTPDEKCDSCSVDFLFCLAITHTSIPEMLAVNIIVSYFCKALSTCIDNGKDAIDITLFLLLLLLIISSSSSSFSFILLI